VSPAEEQPQSQPIVMDGQQIPSSTKTTSNKGSSSRKILILGGPQVGKSTLLEHIALQWSQESLFHHEDFQAVFHIRFSLLFSNWADQFSFEEIRKYPWYCFVWFCIQQEPGFQKLPQAKPGVGGGDQDNNNNDDEKSECLTKEEIFAYLSLPKSTDKTLLLVHRFDEVDQNIQSCPEHSRDYEIFESMFEFTHVIFTAREGFTYSPNMKRFDRFVEGRIVMEMKSGDSQQPSQQQQTVSTVSNTAPNITTTTTSPSRSPSRSPSKNMMSLLAAGLGVGNNRTDHQGDISMDSSKAVAISSEVKDKESPHVKRSINTALVVPINNSGDDKTNSPQNSSSSGIITGVFISNTQKRIFPESSYEDHLQHQEEIKYTFMAQNMIMNVTVIMECEKLGFICSEKLDELEKKLSQCLQSHAYLFDSYPHKEVIDTFTAILHRCQLLLIVLKESTSCAVIDINDPLVKNTEFWKRYGKMVSNSLAGVEEDIDANNTGVCGSGSGCIIC
jgi:hypothetical protein